MTAKHNIPQRLATTLKALFVAAFFAVLWMPLAFSGRATDASLAPIEKREKAQLPAWSWQCDAIRRWPTAFADFFRDHFGLRDPMIRAHSLLYACILHASPSDRVVLGKDQWLFLNSLATRDGDTLSDYRRLHPLNQQQLEGWRQLLQDHHDWLDHRDIRFLVVLIPSKGLVYPDYLPDRYTRVGDTTPLDQLMNYLGGRTDVEVLNLLPAMEEARNIRRAYFKTDTHWNDYGAFRGASATASVLTDWFPSIVPKEDADYRFEEFETAGDLSKMLGLQDVLRETHEQMIPVKTRGPTYVKGEGDLPDVITELPGADLPSVVIFRDSFTTQSVRFLAEYFRRATFRWYLGGLDMKIVEREHPDLVILAVGARRLRSRPLYTPRVRDEAARLRSRD